MCFVIALALLACSGDDDEPTFPGGNPESTAETAAPTPTGDTATGEAPLVLLQGVPATSSFTVGALTGRQGQDLVFDLAGLTTDARGRAMVPGDVAELILLELVTDEREAVAALLSGRGPTPDDAIEWWATPFSGTSAVLTSFMARGAPFVPDAYFVPSNDRGWLLIARDAAGGALHAATLEPDGAGATSVPLIDGLSTWTFTPGVVAGLPVLEGGAPLVDWSAAVDLYGGPIDPELADRLELYAVPRGTAVDPEDHLAGATAVYGREVAGDTEAELSYLRADDASLFAGFDTSSDWWVALSCTACVSRAPLLLVPLSVESR